MKIYQEVYNQWSDNPVNFWLRAAQEIDWISPPSRGFDPDSGVYGSWFPDAEGNICYNCLDRHVESGRGEQAALLYDSPVTGQKATYTYNEMLREVIALASVLQMLDVGKGDRVIIYMPMVVEAVFAMLACARIGAIHSVVFGGFASKELATRIDDAKPKVILSASCGIEPSRVIAYKPLLDEAIELAQYTPQACVVCPSSYNLSQISARAKRGFAHLFG